MAVATAPVPAPAAADTVPVPAPGPAALEFVELADLKPTKAGGDLDEHIDKRMAILAFEVIEDPESHAVTGANVQLKEIIGAGLTGPTISTTLGKRAAVNIERRLKIAPEGKIVAATVKREKRSVILV